jgi:ABC-type transport system involved in multi-copper enzyme maturation permease subunit
MIADPLSIRELRGTTRRWQTYALRVLYIGLIGLVVWQFYDQTAGRPLQPSEYAELSRKLYYAFLALQVAFVTLAAIWAASDSVLREVRTGTLGLLYLTPLTAPQVAFGKWKASMAHAGSLILCGAPVLAVCVFLGGVGPLDLATSLSTTLGIAGIAAAFSFHFSSAVRSQTAVLGLTIAAMVGFSIAPLWFGMFGLFEAFAWIHPVFALGASLWGAQTGVSGEWGWAGALPASMAVSWFLVRTSAGRLGRKGVEVPRPDEPVLAGVPAAWQREAMAARRSSVPEERPLFWKELATRAAARLDPDVRRAVAWIFVIFLGLAWLATQGLGFGMIYFVGFLYLGLAAASGSSIFSYEKEGRRFDMLLSTPVSNAEIVRAKLAAGLLSPEALRAGLLLLAVIVGWTARSGAFVMAATLPTAVLSILTTFLLSAAASLYSPNARSAFLLASGSLLLLLFASPLVVPPLAAIAHPAFVLAALESDAPVQGPSTPLQARALGALAPFAVFHLAAIGGLYVALVRGVKRVTGRA